jgi:DNA repair exonuclease SbcCD ATPase subunit
MKPTRRWIDRRSQRGSVGGDRPDPQSRQRLIEFHQTLNHLEERLRHLRSALRNLAQFEQIQNRLAEADQLSLASDEIKALQQQAEELELSLSGQFFSWQQLKEPFWQAVRFGGLGLVLGWLLRGCSGG